MADTTTPATSSAVVEEVPFTKHVYVKGTTKDRDPAVLKRVQVDSVFDIDAMLSGANGYMSSTDKLCVINTVNVLLEFAGFPRNKLIPRGDLCGGWRELELLLPLEGSTIYTVLLVKVEADNFSKARTAVENVLKASSKSATRTIEYKTPLTLRELWNNVVGNFGKKLSEYRDAWAFRAMFRTSLDKALDLLTAVKDIATGDDKASVEAEFQRCVTSYQDAIGDRHMMGMSSGDSVEAHHKIKLASGEELVRMQTTLDSALVGLHDTQLQRITPLLPTRPVTITVIYGGEKTIVTLPGEVVEEKLPAHVSMAPVEVANDQVANAHQTLREHESEELDQDEPPFKRVRV